jgi:hypothetical protein
MSVRVKNMSKNYSTLLIKEPPLQVLPTLAKLIGLNEAIVIQQIHYWLENQNSSGRLWRGKKWVYNTYEEWQESNFPFWSVRTIQRTFLNLEEAGILVSEQLDKKDYDRKKFYRINYDALEALEGKASYSGTFDDDNLARSEDDNLARSLIESETTTETTNTAQAPGVRSNDPQGKETLQGMGEGLHSKGGGQSSRESTPFGEVDLQGRVSEALTLFAGIPEIIPLAEAFILESKIFPASKDVKGWAVSLKKLHVNQITPTDIHKVIVEARKRSIEGHEWPVSDPFSIEKLAISFCGQQKHHKTEREKERNKKSEFASRLESGNYMTAERFAELFPGRAEKA